MGLADFDRVPLLFGPSPVHPLARLSEHLGGAVETWAKREDCHSGLADALDSVEERGGKPYAIPAGASDHPLGGLIERGSRVLYAHLGGQPALNAYAGAF
jgi:1-aminocyclopropane-1-carboxylate deaminase/D-cysteine desulfhydrase-like pyridoxal-dependent ACC family enzyme